MRCSRLRSAVIISFMVLGEREAAMSSTILGRMVAGRGGRDGASTSSGRNNDE